ncbi:MAG: hypothetical protein K9L56_13285 [Clostridiales bacterium]|nr:hypothetical protein [Clostridiales bacterium]
MASINDIEIFIEKEKIISSNTISSFPTENNKAISDNKEQSPYEIQVSGLVVGTNAFESLQGLRKLNDNSEIVNYKGRNIFNNFLIKDFDTEHDNTISNGFKFQMSLKQVFIAELEETNINFNIVKPQEVNPESNIGKQSLARIPDDEDSSEFGLSVFGKTLPSVDDLKAKADAEEQLSKTKQRNSYQDEILGSFIGDERKKKSPDVANYIPGLENGGGYF